MKTRLITPPENEPISLEEAKLYLRVDHDDEDALIKQLITAAREFCEQYQKRVHGEQTWEVYPARAQNYYQITHPVPIKNIDEVEYLLEDGTTTETLSSSDFRSDLRSDTLPAELFIVNPPTVKLDKFTPITIKVTAGSNEVPARVVQAMYLLIGTFYENRESFSAQATGIQVQINNRRAVEALLDPDRIMSF